MCLLNMLKYLYNTINLTGHYLRESMFFFFFLIGGGGGVSSQPSTCISSKLKNNKNIGPILNHLQSLGLKDGIFQLPSTQTLSDQGKCYILQECYFSSNFTCKK